MKMAPDSYRYLALGAGERVYPPFNRRILFSLVLRDSKAAWRALTLTSVVLLPFLVGVYILTKGGSWQGATFGAILMAGMPSIKYWIDVPILTDAPAMCLALIAVLLPWPYNLVVACVGGLGRETVPLFAALYAWNPMLLFGIVPVAIWSILAPKGSDQMNREEWLDHPFKNAMRFKAGKWLSPDYMVYPWGAAIIALLYPTWQLAATLAVAYSQLFVATDWVRLYVWAAPVMCLAAAQVDVRWMLLLIIIHIFNVKKGPGT